MDNELLYNLSKTASDKGWTISRDGHRVILACDGIFKCFINRAFELKSGRSVLSAHMVLNDNITGYSCARLQFWTTSAVDSDDQVLNTILRDLHNIQTYCESALAC